MAQQRPTAATAAAPPDGWQNTRAQTALATQFIDDEEQYLGGDQRDVGRPVGHDDRELFISCAPGEALQQQFEHLKPEFIAVHDIATRSSKQLIAGLAAVAGRAVQKLVIRRQGFGTAVATLDFVEMPNGEAAPFRIYSTTADAEAPLRHEIARALLAFSKLGVMMVGNLAPPALAEQFQRWQAELKVGWPNRNLLLLPLSAANALASQGLELARGSAVLVRTTPQVTRATDAWQFIESSWVRLRTPASSAVPSAPSAPSAPPARPNAKRVATQSERAAVSVPMSLDFTPMPTVAGRLAPAPGETRDAALASYVKQVGKLAGVVSCSVFEMNGGREVMHAGADTLQVELARHGHELLAAISAASRDLGLGTAPPEAAITLGGHHLLLRGVPQRPGLALHVVFEKGSDKGSDKSGGNLTLARLRLERLDDSLKP